MKTEKLLDAIGNIDDMFIEEATPGTIIKRTPINWIKYGSLIACFCICVISLWGASRLFSTKSSEPDSAAPSEGAMMEEGKLADGDITEAVTEEESAAEEPAEEALAESESATNSIAYGFIMNEQTYYPISFEERKYFGLVPEEDTGLTADNTYQIIESDLGEIMGTVETSENEALIGATVYHFANFPDSNDICIVDVNGYYEFYVNANFYLNQ